MKNFRIRIQNRTCFIGINRPERKNSFTREMVEDLTSFLKASDDSSEFKALVFYGEKGCFSSGTDFDWLLEGKEQTDEENQNDIKRLSALYDAIYHFPKPTIAMIEKGALGTALGIIACVDLAVADPDCQFSFTDAQLGFVATTLTPYLIKKTGIANTKKLLLTSTIFNAHEALSCDLLQYISKPKQVKVKTNDILRKIGRSQDDTIQHTKALINQINDTFFSIGENSHNQLANSIFSTESEKTLRAV